MNELKEILILFSQAFYRFLKLCSDNKAVAGFLGLSSLAGFILAFLPIINDTNQPLSIGNNNIVINGNNNLKVSEKNDSEIVTTLINKHQSEAKFKDEQVKALTQAISDLSKGQGVIGSKEQIDSAMRALVEGKTEKAKGLFTKERA